MPSKKYYTDLERISAVEELKDSIIALENDVTKILKDLPEKSIIYMMLWHLKNSKNHVISLVESEKKALCPLDTKRWIYIITIDFIFYLYTNNITK